MADLFLCYSHLKGSWVSWLYTKNANVSKSWIIHLPIILEYSSLGCWREDLTSSERAIPDLQTDQYQHYMQLPRMLHNIVSECAQKTKSYGYSVFGVRDHHQCVSDPHAGHTYSKYGPSSLCRNGTGGPGAINVYSLEGKIVYDFCQIFRFL